ncbi:MAG: hypothetical protein SFW36_02810 [Leptolyngbyaceae cyanobacterium bins.59]|nr:hypothetical protein [Leptolyngbyaceae cyanobacterium bins.59]
MQLKDQQNVGYVNPQIIEALEKLYQLEAEPSTKNLDPQGPSGRSPLSKFMLGAFGFLAIGLPLAFGVFTLPGSPATMDRVEQVTQK